MNVKKLKEVLKQAPDDAEVLVWDKATERIYKSQDNLSIDTDMRTGETKFIILADDEEAGPLRAYEPHPAFEDVNAWAWEGE
jgi:hypothetical protein